jgi:hypothetical protein
MLLIMVEQPDDGIDNNEIRFMLKVQVVREPGEMPEQHFNFLHRRDFFKLLPSFPDTI